MAQSMHSAHSPWYIFVRHPGLAAVKVYTMRRFQESLSQSITTPLLALLPSARSQPVADDQGAELPLVQAQKMRYGRMPLYISGEEENPKQFASMHATQRHMVDTNQCRMAYDDNEEEYADFYDFSAQDQGSGGVQPSPDGQAGLRGIMAADTQSGPGASHLPG